MTNEHFLLLLNACFAPANILALNSDIRPSFYEVDCSVQPYFGYLDGISPNELVQEYLSRRMQLNSFMDSSTSADDLWAACVLLIFRHVLQFCVGILDSETSNVSDLQHHIDMIKPFRSQLLARGPSITTAHLQWCIANQWLSRSDIALVVACVGHINAALLPAGGLLTVWRRVYMTDLTALQRLHLAGVTVPPLPPLRPCLHAQPVSLIAAAAGNTAVSEPHIDTQIETAAGSDIVVTERRERSSGGAAGVFGHPAHDAAHDSEWRPERACSVSLALMCLASYVTVYPLQSFLPPPLLPSPLQAEKQMITTVDNSALEPVAAVGLVRGVGSDGLIADVDTAAAAIDAQSDSAADTPAAASPMAAIIHPDTSFPLQPLPSLPAPPPLPVLAEQDWQQQCDALNDAVSDVSETSVAALTVQLRDLVRRRVCVAPDVGTPTQRTGAVVVIALHVLMCVCRVIVFG